jgi:hypothetical protein
MSAIDLHARPSKDFAAKLAETTALLVQAAARLRARRNHVTQASSLGAEDVVISHIINSHQLDIGIFVLETGRLHKETLALLDQFKATSRAPVTVYTPVNESVVQFVAREGKDAMYKSIALRKACCGIRKMEPLGRALDGKKAWISGLRREQSGARADVPWWTPPSPAPNSTPWPTGPGATSGTTLPKTALPTTRCTTRFSPALAASPARAPSAWVKTSAPAAGGGKTSARRNADCTSSSIPTPMGTFRPAAHCAPSLQRRLAKLKPPFRKPPHERHDRTHPL